MPGSMPESRRYIKQIVESGWNRINLRIHRFRSNDEPKCSRVWRPMNKNGVDDFFRQHPWDPLVLSLVESGSWQGHRDQNESVHSLAAPFKPECGWGGGNIGRSCIKVL